MARAAEYREGVSVPLIVWQSFLISAVFYMWASPVIQPVKIMVVLFHEMSHGLMALASGGRVVEIVITADEGGACETEGGVALLIVSAGYLGSMFFGGLLLYLSRFKGCVPVVFTALTLTLGAAIFTVLHDPYSRTFASALAASFIFVGILSPTVVGAFFLQVLGTVSCLYSIFDIYWDILASRTAGSLGENDAIAFSQLTGIPSDVVGMMWLAISTLYFLAVLKIIVTQGAAPSRAAHGGSS
jgi:hypothetical protein